ncbi:Caspase domain-containing protein [Marivirga sericea]|uniref:Caspase domain-containing protein n=1 Tax=Marivirga sericea TaxID=1028 RepID=A0A1X7IFT8_9BACT|nr:caspase family protein [Marivirga sericea]SMG13586.1 Caspase domain-containing protein [Marivirga sericea]
MKRLVFTFCFISLSVLNAQDIDISGFWYGKVEVPFSSSLTSTFYFEQKESSLIGYLKIKKYKSSDSAKANLSGTISDKELMFRSTDFEYSYPGACLSIHELVYEKNGDVERLSGKWTGNWELSTCPPSLSGKIHLVKQSSKSPPKPDSQTQNVITSDEYSEYVVSELKKRRYYALLIGIEDYQDQEITDLNHPVSDAERIGEVLNTYYAFEKENISFLKNPTRSQIIETLDQLSHKITEKDQLLIFYAGHGIWDEKLNQGFWLPSNASSKNKAQWISNSTIRDYIGGINTKHTLLITDACFSGGIFKERDLNLANGRAILEMYKLTSRKAITSGTLKTVPDESVFLKYLAQRLIENENVLLSAEELFNSFKIAVINNSKNGQVPQYGAIYQSGDEGGDFIFLRNE